MEQTPETKRARQPLVAYQCPDCRGMISTEADTIAVHMLEEHGWNYEYACTWLRAMVEGGDPL